MSCSGYHVYEMNNACCLCLAEHVSSECGHYTDEYFEKYIDFSLDESKGGIPNDGGGEFWWLTGMGLTLWYQVPFKNSRTVASL